MSRLRIAFAGTPEFAVPALRALAASPHELVGVLTQPDRPRGRGLHVAPGAVKAEALRLALPLSQPQTLRTDEDRAALAQWRPDLLVVVAYGLLLPQAVLELPRLGCVNIHASLLPRWRGAAPIQRAILAGDSVTGVTIMLMDAGLDTGPILLQRSLALDAHATAGSLHDVLAELGAEALLAAIEELAGGRSQPRPQAPDGATYAPKIEKTEALIDWTHPAAAIDRQVRAFNPWPAAETRLGAEQLRIFAAEACAEGPAGGAAGGAAGTLPGTVLEVSARAIRVQCGAGVLALTELQRAGRRRVPARDFANSGALVPGMRLGSW